jgi:uncharacterized membrane protein YraQ (UPF0718 family)/regulator of protease activity HflC (stomatin/prohibitin superfamily)
MSFIVEMFDQVIWFMKLSSPYMIFGIVVAGILRFILSEDRFMRSFGGNDFKSVGLAALFGIPLPLCSCSVLPMMVTMRQRGASKGATTSFLISTPETGVDSISITYALLDPIFTVARPVAALVSAFFTGSVVNLFVRRGWDENHEPSESPDSARGSSGDGKTECKTDGNANCNERSQEKGPFFQRSLRYGFGPLMDDLTPLLILAFLGSGFIAVIVPESFFDNPVTSGWTGMLVMLVVGIPFYVCATSSTPLIAALLMKGLSPGAALVFLLAGPVTNLGTILAVLRYMGRKVMLIYVVCTAGITLMLGGIIESIYQDLGIPVTAIVGQTTGLLPEWLKVICLFILLALMVSSAVRTRLAQRWADKVRSWCRPLGFDPLGRAGITVIILFLLGSYLATGFTAVDMGEKGWLFTFGKVERTAAGEIVTYEPGLVMHWPYPFQTLRTGRPDEVRNLASGFRRDEVGEAASLLTIGDVGNLEELDVGLEAQVMDGQESLVSLKFSVQYRLTDPYAYTMLFDEPEVLIEGYAAAAVRTVCAKRSTQDILVGHRRELETLSRAALQEELDGLGAGVEVLRVNFVDVHAPPEVHFAFRDVASAAEDKHKQELEGESAFRSTLADARALAFRVEQEAEIYRYMIESAAQGNSVAFTARAVAYNETREITRLRMFLDTMRTVLAGTPMVIPLKEGIDVELWLRGETGGEPPFTEEAEPAPEVETPAKKKPDRPSWYDALKR